MPTQVKNLLKTYNLKATPQRITIYKIMKNLGHASADLVYKEIGDQFPTLTVATVYNVLESFVEVGLIKRRLSSNNKMFFDVNTYEHCHLYCQKTHKFLDFDDTDLMKMVHEYISKKNIENFELSTIDIQLSGYIKN
ncbi:MAG: transcriptional repressor [Bacteroidales bacterium]|nr:transcriptional repressor [Bacteroidales bacterium]